MVGAGFISGAAGVAGLVSAGGGMAGVTSVGIVATGAAGVVPEAAGAALVSEAIVAAAAGSTGVIIGAGLVSAGGGVAGVISAGIVATGAAGVVPEAAGAALVSEVVVAAAAGSTGVIIGAGLVSAGGGVAGVISAGIVAAGGLCGSVATCAAGVGATAFGAGATLGLGVIVVVAGWASIGVGITDGFFAGGGVAGAGVIVAAGGLCSSIATGAAGVGVGSGVIVLAAGVVAVAAGVVAVAAGVVALAAGIVALVAGIVVLVAGVVAVAAGIVTLAAGVIALVAGVVALAGTVLVVSWLGCTFTAPGEVTTTGGAWVCGVSNSLHLLFQSRARGGLNRSVVRADGNETRANDNRASCGQQLENLHNAFLRQFPFGCNSFSSRGKQFLPHPRQRVSQRRTQQNPAHFGPGNFDALLQVEHIAGAQSFNRFHANQNRPRAGQPHADLAERQRVRVGPARGQVRFGAVEIFVKQRTEFRLVHRRQQNRRQQTRLLQFFRGQITAALFQIRRQIAQDVHQLQSLAKTDAVRQQLRVVQPRLRKQMRAAHLRPEFAHAAGDAIRVVVELGGGFQRDNFSGGRPGEPAQIQFLSARDGVEDGADQLLVGGRKGLQQREAVLDFFQQQLFGGRTLMLRQPAEIQRRGGRTLNAFAQSFERVEPLFQRDEFGVGDGVGRAREQIGEADLRAHGGRQHAQRQIKRARRRLEQII